MVEATLTFFFINTFNYYFLFQSKDKLISSLKEGGGFEGDDTGVSFAELEELKHERDMLKEELKQSKLYVQQLRADLQVRRLSQDLRWLS